MVRRKTQDVDRGNAERAERFMVLLSVTMDEGRSRHAARFPRMAPHGGATTYEKRVIM